MMQFGFTSSGGPTTGALSYQGLWDAMSVMSKYNCVFTSKVEVAAQPLI